MRGNWTICLAILGWGTWSFLNKIASHRLHVLHLQIIGSSLAICLAPVYLFLLRQPRINPTPTPFSLGDIAIAGLASLLATMASISFLSRLQHEEAGTTTVLVATYPLLTMILSVLFLGESITFAKIIGSLLIILGVISLAH